MIHYPNNSSLEKVRTPTTMIGEYLRVGNPCTTIPCLPGMVYAVLADDRCYYLTVNGKWMWENKQWGEYTPKERDHVKVTGYLSERRDVKGYSFYEIEVVSLRPTQLEKSTQ